MSATSETAPSTQLDALRVPFEAKHIGKLPRVSCVKCRKSPEKVCDQHSKSKCSVCGNWITSAHVHLDYVGHAQVTNRLLDVDPYWTWEPMAYDEHGSPIFERDNDGNATGLWIRLTVLGITRPGYGNVDTVKTDAEKELIGDALRNAAMRFGVALHLWEKGELESFAGSSEPEQPNTTPQQSSSSGLNLALDIPFKAAEIREAAKQAGCRWDKDAKVWRTSDEAVYQRIQDQIDAFEGAKSTSSAPDLEGQKATLMAEIKAQPAEVQARIKAEAKDRGLEPLNTTTKKTVVKAWRQVLESEAEPFGDLDQPAPVASGPDEVEPGEAATPGSLDSQLAAKVELMKSALEEGHGFTTEEAMVGWVNLTLNPPIKSLSEIKALQIDKLLELAEEEPF